MNEITKFFNDLNEQIKFARSKRSLKLIWKRAKLFVKKVNSDDFASSSIKKRAKINMKKTQILIKKAMKKL